MNAISAAQRVSRSRAKTLAAGAMRVEVILRDPAAIAAMNRLIAARGSRVAAVTYALLKRPARYGARYVEISDRLSELAADSRGFGNSSVSAEIDCIVASLDGLVEFGELDGTDEPDEIFGLCGGATCGPVL